MTTTTVLSACGGFTTRRNSHIQAKNELKLAASSSSPVSSGHVEITRDSQQQQQEPTTVTTAATSTTATTATTATAAATATTATLCPRLNVQQIFSPMSATNYWVLGTILLIVTVSLPTSTNALPRRMHGRHLILPHRHHVHLRSAGSECKLSKMPITPERIESAINISHSTRTMYSQMMEKWLRETMNMSSSEAEHHFSYHYLRLDYPLSAEANNSDYDGADTKSPIEELPKILDSLNIAYHFLMNQKTDSNQKYFSDFIEKTSHNLNEALGMVNMDISCMKRPDYKYNTDYVKLEYGVVVETLKLLNVIEVKYRAMSKQQWATPL